jgi:hypothetical protein
VTQLNSGKWFVIFDGAMTGPFTTHADAWRWIDREIGSPVSAAEWRHVLTAVEAERKQDETSN